MVSASHKPRKRNNLRWQSRGKIFLMCEDLCVFRCLSSLISKSFAPKKMGPRGLSQRSTPPPPGSQWSAHYYINEYMFPPKIRSPRHTFSEIWAKAFFQYTILFFGGWDRIPSCRLYIQTWHRSSGRQLVFICMMLHELLWMFTAGPVTN